MSEPQHQQSNIVGYAVVAISTGVANLLSYAQSFNAGTFATGLTIVGGGVVGFVVLWLQKVGPAWVDYKTYRDLKRDGTLSGKLDRLNEALDAEREGKEIARQLAKDARDLAEINRRRMEKSDLRVAELMAELKAMAKRLEDANRKLHDLSSPIQTAAQNSMLALQIQDENAIKLDKTLAQAQANAGLTTQVDGKVAHVVETVDQIAGKSSGEYPPANGEAPGAG